MNRKVSFSLLTLAAIGLLAFSTPINAGAPGMVVLGNGGGSIEDARLDNEFELRTADFTFSFFAGLNKHGELKGSFHFKKKYPDGGVSVGVSTEITEFEWEPSDECRWVTMDGMMTLHASWAAKPLRGHEFTVTAWDCNDDTDLIWFQIYRPNGGAERWAMSLFEPADITGGNINIR
ncbi:MAG: hypothetical protein HKN57_08450 [Xanthomonadales bacterium]|nr:hypothetical protein [Gammaproteobacteria bacterium]NND57270.1 hypothetical protein [Xanthomonadales bacterium]NNK51624.1 hypothetical protein [Xanthomonadales bacterium]